MIHSLLTLGRSRISSGTSYKPSRHDRGSDGEEDEDRREPKCIIIKAGNQQRATAAFFRIFILPFLLFLGLHARRRHCQVPSSDLFPFLLTSFFSRRAACSLAFAFLDPTTCIFILFVVKTRAYTFFLSVEIFFIFRLIHRADSRWLMAFDDVWRVLRFTSDPQAMWSRVKIRDDDDDDGDERKSQKSRSSWTSSKKAKHAIEIANVAWTFVEVSRLSREEVWHHFPFQFHVDFHSRRPHNIVDSRSFFSLQLRTKKKSWWWWFGIKNSSIVRNDSELRRCRKKNNNSTTPRRRTREMLSWSWNAEADRSKPKKKRGKKIASDPVTGRS